MLSKKLKVGIDARCLENKLTGIGRYVYELCRVIDQQLDNAEFFLYSQEPLNLDFFSERWHFRDERVALYRKFKSSFWFKTRCGILATRDNLDVFWGTATLLPQLNPNVLTIVTVHDLNYRIVPQTMGTANMWAHRLFFVRDVQKADIVLANSKGTASRLYDLIGRRVNDVVTPAVSSQFARLDDSYVSTVLEKFAIKVPYLLSVATWEPRKNIELLIQTYLKMKQSGKLPKHGLVLVGGKGWKDNRLKALLSNNTEKTVYPLGFVDDNDLSALYSGADTFIFPSIYEGFGIPLLEARACGTSVVATDIPELRESGGEDGIYVLPTENDISRGILASIKRGKLPPSQNIPSWSDEGKKMVRALLS